MGELDKDLQVMFGSGAGPCTSCFYSGTVLWLGTISYYQVPHSAIDLPLWWPIHHLSNACLFLRPELFES